MAFAYVGRMYVIGRGIEFGTAREVALKLTETCRVAAEPLTATDLAHGPIAALDSMFPVWTIASRDESLPAVLEAAARVRGSGRDGGGERQCRPRDRRRRVRPAGAGTAPSDPFSTSLGRAGPALCGRLAHAKGLDADYPVGLSKVTRAR